MGLAGQVRKFDLQEFCSDWEPTDGRPLPCTFPSDAEPAPPAEAQSALCAVAPGADSVRPGKMTQYAAPVGMPQKLVVFYLPDYAPESSRMAKTSALWRELGQMLPEYEIEVAMATGPFPDDYGATSFSRNSRGRRERRPVRWNASGTSSPAWRRLREPSRRTNRSS